MTLSERGAIGDFGLCFALRAANEWGGCSGIDRSVLFSLSPSGLARARGAINHIEDKLTDFTKKGVFTRPVKRKLSGEKRRHSTQGYIVADGEGKREDGQRGERGAKAL